MLFFKQLYNSIQKSQSLLCVGLDTDLDKIPTKFKKQKRPMLEFNKHVIESTSDITCVYKINSAFYEACGKIDELKDTIAYIKKNTDVPTILDAKRGDIGNTAKQYSKFCFEYLNADAVTLSPYMGYDTMEPFLEWKDKGVFVLCLTSNPGSKDFEQLKVGNKKLYEVVANKVNKWNKKTSSLGIVVGATKPTALAKLRKEYPMLPFLVPGLGTQAGDLKSTVKNGTKNNGLSVYNVSRAVLYPKSGSIKQAALKIRNDINANLDKKYFL